jgi:aconitate hydratase
LVFDPLKDSLRTDDGKEFRFSPPSGESLPSNGYEDADEVYTPPPVGDRSGLSVTIDPDSERLQKLQPFAPWSGENFADCRVLIKVKGKCTTDHITPAGPWFRFRGHLENISNNTLIGAVNAENDKVNCIVNRLTGLEGDVPGTARSYKAAGQPWLVLADHNYGEGSSREHAALQPRYLGGVAIVAKSFARIHEANLKKQGLLALTFADEADYDRIQSSDVLSIVGLDRFAPGKSLTLKIRPSGASDLPWDCKVNHTFTQEQIEYFKAGSALNLMASRTKRGEEAQQVPFPDNSSAATQLRT